MKTYFITFRSITFAQRGERLLRQGGVDCVLQRTPKWMEQRGCGYSLRLWTDQVYPVLEILQAGKVPLGKVYRQGAGGQMEEWNFDLS